MIIVLDTETTGREPPEVIELAYGELILPELFMQDAVEFRYKPAQGSCWGALSVHHILDEELEKEEPSTTAKVPEEAVYIVGHNIDYDWKALGSPPVKRICTLAIARSLYPDLDSHKLGAMVYFLEPDKRDARTALKGAHSAYDDMMMCHFILQRMLANKNLRFSNPEDLWAFSELCRIPQVMTFGKHRGTKIKELPLDYRTWMLRQADMDPYVLQAVRETMRRG